MVSTSGIVYVVNCVCTEGLNQVICGNPARALRARRKNKGLAQQVRIYASS